jgi:hypothetical protein
LVMISVGYVKISCDKCGEENEVEMTPLAREGNYDTRNIKGWLQRNGYKTIGRDEHICADCQEDDSER